jgi:hypothetical protein
MKPTRILALYVSQLLAKVAVPGQKVPEKVVCDLGCVPDPNDPETPPLAVLQPADVIYEIDEARFWDKSPT